MEPSTNHLQKPGAVFLTGGTGTVCQRIAALLQAANIPCTAASRSGQAPPVPNPSVVAGVRFDWADQSTWEPALKLAGEVRAVYLVMPGMLEPGPTAAAFVDLARTKFGVKRFVLQSSTAIEEGGPAMGQVHTLLKERGDRGEIGWAVLRPSWFQENFATQKNHLESIRAQNKIYSTTGPGRIPFVSARDIAAVAVAALTAPPADPPNREYFVVGPELLSYSDVAAGLSRVLGRRIAHVDLAEAELARRYHEGYGIPEQYANILAGMDTGIRNGAEEHNSLGGDVLEVTGCPPRGFADFVEENRDLWAEAS